jgi:hypothetical protein
MKENRQTDVKAPASGGLRYSLHCAFRAASTFLVISASLAQTLLSTTKSALSYSLFAAVTCFRKPRLRACFQPPSTGLDILAQGLEIGKACFSRDRRSSKRDFA